MRHPLDIAMLRRPFGRLIPACQRRPAELSDFARFVICLSSPWATIDPMTDLESRLEPEAASSTGPANSVVGTPSGPASSAQAQNGNASPELRADVRRLSSLLGQTLVRQHGEELLELVEQVRALTKRSREDESAQERQAATDLVRGILAELPIATATPLVRAFSAYFVLANAAEQVHRVRALRGRPAAHGHLATAVAEIAEMCGPQELAGAINSLAVQPVFTAHPTEASRRSVLTKLRALADILAVRTPPDTAARIRQDRQLAELVDLIWQTDEIRQARPTPVDEARNVLYYFHELLTTTVPELTGELASEVATFGVTLPPEATPLTLGTWIGGDRDGNPNVTAAITHEILQLQNRAALSILIDAIDKLIMALSGSTAIISVSDELLTSIERDLAHLPRLEPRVKEINAAEPYRLKLTCIKAKLINTRRRVDSGSIHEPGRDYAGREQVIADLAVIAQSLSANGGQLAVDGILSTIRRTVASTGLFGATMDIREHAEAHHQAIGQLVDRLGEQSRPYADLPRADRFRLLSRSSRRGVRWRPGRLRWTPRD